MKSRKIEIMRSGRPEIMSYGSPYKFDKMDKIILKSLDEDGRISLTDIAAKTTLTREAVKRRIQKLVKEEVILGFKPILNPPRMGFPIINYVFLSLYNPTAEREKELLHFLKLNKHITYVATLIGKWDYIIDIIAQDQGRFDTIFKEIRQQFPDLIKDYEILGVLNEYKYEQVGNLVYD